MKDLLDKLSSYNIFNYLLPGIVFVVLSDAFTSYSFIQQDIIIGVFLYYFIGLVISRVGSLIVEPVLKRIKFVRYTAYREFISASHTDTKLDILSEVNNMYRTFCALFLLVLSLKGYENVTASLPIVDKWGDTALAIGMLVMFLLAYRKQTHYITQRIEATLKKE